MNKFLQIATIIAVELLMASCGGGGGGEGGGSATTAPLYQLSPSADSRVVTEVSVAGGTLSLYDDNHAFLKTASGDTFSAYTGTEKIKAIKSVEDGIQTQFDDGSVYLSVDGLNLGGGGKSTQLPAWNKLSNSNPFGPRDSARGIRFGGKILLSGGYFESPNVSYFDLWSSPDDGQTWVLGFGTTTPEAGPRGDFYNSYSPIISDGQRLYAIGSSVWTSDDGLAWTAGPTPGPAIATDDTHAFYLNGTFIFLDTAYGIVYTSPDAADWTASPAPLPMSARCGSVTTMAFGKIWLYGGGDCNYGGVQNDIWNSIDGVNWTQATVDGAAKSAEWPARMWPCLTATDNGTLWLFGGYTPMLEKGENMHDLWYSRDGLNWKQLPIATATVPWRHAPTCYASSNANKLLVVAGKAGLSAPNSQAAVQNDVSTIELPLDEFLP